MAMRKRSATSGASLLKAATAAKPRSPNDSSHLTGKQQQELIDRFSNGWSDKDLTFRFPVKCLQSNITVELNAGWRTRPVYSSDVMYLSSEPRVTKRSGVAFRFVFSGDAPEWVSKDGFKVAEMTYDKAVEVFGSDFEDLITEAMGMTWASAIAQIAGDEEPIPEIAPPPPTEPHFLCSPDEAW